MKNIIYILSLLVFKLTAQTITPYVINSAGGGGQVGSSGITVYYNIGEPIITTVANTGSTSIVTQGFLQPEIFGSLRLILQPLLIQPISCESKSDAILRLDTLKTPANSYLVYKWYFNGTNICPNADCVKMDSLAAGSYSIVVSAYCYTCTPGSHPAIDSVVIPFTIAQNNIECDSLEIYNAFSPDGNTINDNWVIDRIENTENTVTIYNRWGLLIKQFKNYDNATTVWKGESKDNPDAIVPNGTYFYVIEIKGKDPKKGWVEVMGR